MAKRITSADIQQQLHDLRKHLDHRLDAMERHIQEHLMSLDQSVADALTAEADALKALAADLATFQTTAQAKQDAMQATIDGLNAGDVITAAKLAELQANAAAFDGAVIAPLSGFTDQIKAMDAALAPVVPTP